MQCPEDRPRRPAGARAADGSMGMASAKIPENSARENFGGIIPDFREHFFGNFGFPDLEAL